MARAYLGGVRGHVLLESLTFRASEITRNAVISINPEKFVYFYHLSVSFLHKKVDLKHTVITI